MGFTSVLMYPVKKQNGIAIRDLFVYSFKLKDMKREKLEYKTSEKR